MVALALALAIGAQQVAALNGTSAETATRRFGASLSQHRDILADSLHLADSLLLAGRLPEARRLTERLRDRHPNLPAVLTMMGRIHLAWPVVGRFQAESLLRRAALLAPDDPEPRYYLGHVGLALGGDDGEQIARRGLVPALALNPDYRDAWMLWLRLYRGDRERRDMLAALAPHRGAWNVDLRSGQLLLELRRFDEASALLADVAVRHPRDPAPLAWRARALFASGHDAEGAAVYTDALRLAEYDTAHALWQQVRGIANAVERANYTATPASGRADFLRVFWARREPDLLTPGNERLGEHFRRLSEAQRVFAVRHPNARYYRSPLYRAMQAGVSGHPGGLDGAERRALNAQCSARRPGVRDETAQASLAQATEPADEPLNLEDRLDDRGRIFLRHGRPDYQLVGSLSDETWCYFRPDGGILRVTFVRRTGGWGASGDMLVTPLMAGEAESAVELLSTDRFSTTSNLSFAFWPAAFRATDRRLTELLVIPDSLWAVAVLIDDAGREVARDSVTDGALRLVAPAGRYLLLLDAARGRRTGRYRGNVTLPDFGGEEPVISSLLLAPGNLPPLLDSLATRAPHGLSLPASQPLRVYAELYHLGQVDSTSRYRATYRFERLDGFIFRRQRDNSFTIAFDRERPFESRLVESLVVDPDRLPKGRYRLHVVIFDQILGVETSSAMLEFRLR